jgi:predicted O-methyltransferase YrrM
VHSPFVFELLEQVIEDDRRYYDFGALKRVRELAERNNQLLTVQDFGAGSRVQHNAQRTVAQIAKTAVSPTWQGEFLFRLVNHFQAKRRLEVGTSLGISSLYQYLPLRQAPLATLEGCPSIAAEAAKNFKKLKATNIQQYLGKFEETLPQALRDLGGVDYVYLDGNHQKAPTLAYFEACLAYSHADTVFVIDDINWSNDMQEAWQAIQAHPQVSLSIDLFFMGLVFLRKEQQQKQQFTLIPARYKPWKMGFFPPTFAARLEDSTNPKNR